MPRDALYCTGAVSAGVSHYAGTAKALKEEGIEPAARLKALPTAVSIFAALTSLQISPLMLFLVVCVRRSVFLFYGFPVACMQLRRPLEDAAQCILPVRVYYNYQVQVLLAGKGACNQHSFDWRDWGGGLSRIEVRWARCQGYC